MSRRSAPATPGSAATTTTAPRMLSSGRGSISVGPEPAASVCAPCCGSFTSAVGAVVGAVVASGRGDVVGAVVAVEAALSNRVSVPRPFVGSNGTHPMPRKETSGHACSWRPVTSMTR